MNKRWLPVIIIILAILLAVFIALIKRGAVTLPIKGGNSASAPALFKKAMDLEARNRLPEAKAAYQALLGEFPNSKEAADWQRKAEGLNIKLLFSPVLTPKSILYTIKPGDTLTKIAREFKTTPELLRISNHFTDDKILPGRKIKVWTAPFSIVVDKSQNTLMLKSEEEVIKTYIVSTGADNSTPVGTFKITNKLSNPTWFKAGAVVAAGSPDNVLGSRWLGLNLPGYGIHGTTEPQSLGRQVTQGCVRMANSDAEELYTIVPEGTEVTIVD